MARPRTGSLYMTKSGWRGRLTGDDGKQRSIDLGTFDRDEAAAKLSLAVKERRVPVEKTALGRFASADAANAECADGDGLSPLELKRFALLAAQRGWSLVAVRGAA